MPVYLAHKRKKRTQRFFQKLEAGVGIEPASTALQAGNFLLKSMTYNNTATRLTTAFHVVRCAIHNVNHEMTTVYHCNRLPHESLFNQVVPQLHL